MIDIVPIFYILIGMCLSSIIAAVAMRLRRSGKRGRLCMCRNRQHSGPCWGGR